MALRGRDSLALRRMTTGAAAVDLCHVAEGIVDAYWEYRLKPWDMAAGVLIVEEAGGKVTTMDGGPFTVFDRSIIASNQGIYEDILAQTRPSVESLRQVAQARTESSVPLLP